MGAVVIVGAVGVVAGNVGVTAGAGAAIGGKVDCVVGIACGGAEAKGANPCLSRSFPIHPHIRHHMDQ